MNMLVLPAAAFALLAFALVWCTKSLVRDNRADTLASVPVTTEQEIRLLAGGTVSDGSAPNSDGFPQTSKFT